MAGLVPAIHDWQRLNKGKSWVAGKPGQDAVGTTVPQPPYFNADAGLSGPTIAARAGGDGPDEPGQDAEATGGPILTPMRTSRAITIREAGPRSGTSQPACGLL